MRKKVLVLVVCLTTLLSCFSGVYSKANLNLFTYPVLMDEPFVAAVSHEVFQYGKGKKITFYISDGESFWESPSISIVDSKDRLVKKLKAKGSWLYKASWDGKNEKKKFVKNGAYRLKYEGDSGTIYYKFQVRKKLNKKNKKKNKYGKVTVPGFSARFPSNWEIDDKNSSYYLILRSPKKKGSGKRCTFILSLFDFRTTGYSDSYIISEYEKFLNREDSPIGKLVKKSNIKIGKQKGKKYVINTKATKNNGYLAKGETNYNATVQKHIVMKKGMVYQAEFITKKGNKKFNKDINFIKNSLKFTKIEEYYLEILPVSNGEDYDFSYFNIKPPENITALIASESVLFIEGNPINYSPYFSASLEEDWSDETTIEKAAENKKWEIEYFEMTPGATPVISDAEVNGMPAKLVLAKIYDEEAKSAIEYGTYFFKVKSTIYSLQYSIDLNEKNFSVETYNNIKQGIEQILSSISVY